VGTIVVGVDGSEGSLAALRFALEEAKVRGDDIKAVNAWHVPPAACWAPGGVDFDEFRRLAEEALDRTMQDSVVVASGVTVTPVLVEGQPADALCAEADGAELLVVGSRGLGGFHGLLVGSVSHQCVHHAPCPVVVVPHRQGA